jgi:hypothetical protein
MKASRTHYCSYVRRATQAAILLSGFAVNPVGAAQTDAATSAAPKNHVLFVGTDLSVKQDGKFYRVVGASKKVLKIEKNHALTEVRLSNAPSIRINKGVKLSKLTANIGNVQTESVDRESARAQLAAMQTSMALMEEASMAADRRHGLVMVLSAVASPTSLGPDGQIVTGPIKKMQDEAAAAYINALPDLEKLTASASTLLTENIMQPYIGDDEVTLDASALPGLNLLGGSTLGDSGSGGSASSFTQGKLPSRSTEVELAFDVSSPEPLEQAYIVVVANYSSPSKPTEVTRQISAREFAHIDSRPQRVKLIHAASLNGLPFKKFDIALFANGQEVATNLSEKRLALTSDQAFQFFLIDHLSTHRGATLPPTPMLMTPRTEFRQQVAKIETNQTIYANVDKMGNVLSMSADAAGTQRLPSSVESALQKVRFLPALNNGAPVEGRIKVTLAQLAN